VAADRRPHRLTPPRERGAGYAVLAAAAQLAIVVPLLVLHAGAPTEAADAQLVFDQDLGAECQIQAMPASGGPLRTVATGPALCAATAAGPVLVATTESGLLAIDPATGSEYRIPLRWTHDGRVIGPSPDRTEVAVSVDIGPNLTPAIDIVDLVSGQLLRQLEPRVGGEPVTDDSGDGWEGVWLSDGIEVTGNWCPGPGEAELECDFVIDPASGAARAVPDSAPAPQPAVIVESPDATEEAISDYSATVTAGPAGGSLIPVYTAPSGENAMALAVGNGGGVLIDSDTLAPSSTLVIANPEGVTPVAPLPGWYSIAGSAVSLPGGGFADEIMQRAPAQAGQTEEVVRVAPDGSITVLSGPWAPRPGNVPQLVGMTV
jgi:hypothetical protein